MNEAKKTLVYYFRTAWEKAGLGWSSDNTTEVESIVDGIYEAAYDDAIDHEEVIRNRPQP